MVKLNKRGWLKIFEAVIAVLLILGSLLLFYQGQRKEIGDDRYIVVLQEEILNQLSENISLRESILNSETNRIKEVINKSLLPHLNFTIRICNLTEHCPLEFYLERDIFVRERIISGTLEEYNPKKIRFFVWKIDQ